MPTYIREWREAAGLTLEQIANRLGVHLSTVQKWEKGKNAMDIRDLERLAELHGVHVTALMFHPNDRAAAARLSRAHDVLSRLPGETADKWLDMGAAFSPPQQDVTNRK